MQENGNGRLAVWTASRLKCSSCGAERLLTMSCKQRGICPSCDAIRAAVFSSFLADELLEDFGHRLWTPTLFHESQRAWFFKLSTAAVFGLTGRSVHALLEAVHRQNSSARKIKQLRRRARSSAYSSLALEITPRNGQTPPLCCKFSSSSSLSAFAPSVRFADAEPTSYWKASRRGNK